MSSYATSHQSTLAEELSAETGVNVNTLLSRKRYAVLRLRERLPHIYEEFTNP